jgi:hypothetical protein
VPAGNRAGGDDRLGQRRRAWDVCVRFTLLGLVAATMVKTRSVGSSVS